MVINYIGPKELAEGVLEEVQALGTEGMIYECDITDFAAVETMMKDILKETGKIDVLVNNAGITKDQLMLRMSQADFSAVIEVNLKGAFNCVKHITRPMFKQRSGCIINMASVIGLVGNTGQVNYAASKAGLIGMTKSLAKEYAARNIRVNAVAPGFIETEMTKILSDDVKKAILERVPMGKLGQPEDIADMVAFLASDNAKYVTGQVMAVDGGMTM